ncbi:MAG: hypothetical protein M1829_000978 [Trizodia sp. TS-e1964]|nr:MAG: hypothetical protein M1829_000978 [Trizodia sp. TS-e1964]
MHPPAQSGLASPVTTVQKIGPWDPGSNFPKTLVATAARRSVATALGRKFQRISLGGVQDESEIRGHRRTYVGAMPEVIASGLMNSAVGKPVFLLDEIDKVGSASFKGDPSAAMLEVLDPEQNHSFRDHYIGIPIELSEVLFIAIANSLESIRPALLETIALSGYTTLERRQIASRHLIPKQILADGLGKRQVPFSNEVIDKIATSYTRKAGVRKLERDIGSVCHSKAVQYAEAEDSSSSESYSPEVTLADLESILGVERFEEELAEKASRPGVVTGLVSYSVGGNGSSSSSKFLNFLALVPYSSLAHWATCSRRASG